MSPPDSVPASSQEPVLPRAARLVRQLSLLYGAMTLGFAVLLAAALLPVHVLGPLGPLAREALAGGLAGRVLGALLTALTPLLGTLALTAARFGFSAHGTAPSAGAAARLRTDPGFAARQGQALIAPAGALLVWLAIRTLWPRAPVAAQPTAANLAAALVLALAFVSLVAERVMNAFPPALLPEAPTVRRQLLLATLLLAAAAAIELGRAAGLAWLRWPGYLLAVIPGLLVTELALRALGRLFLPAPEAGDARAVTESILAAALTGGPRAPAILLRTHLGLDFARSWALAFLSAAILPALCATALFCWALTGLKLIDLEHRGVYERFGAPVAVLGPGLHLLLPWPLGRLRTVEYGAIHSVAIGVDQSEPQAPERIGAEATPPVSLNRLWESAHPDQAHYLVPSAGTAEQSFQSVSTEIYVLYRVGLTDSAALQSVYTVAQPASLIRDVASRLVLRYFNSRTLDAVLGARRQSVGATLRAELAADPAIHRSGMDIVSVLIEEIHPPAGAAAAYHAVQAAEINANASIANELGRARRTAGVAREEAHQLTAAADAQAAETVDAAAAAAYRFDADRRAYAADKDPFLIEHTFDRLVAALAHSRLTLIDHRLAGGQPPILDLRTPAASVNPRTDTSGAGTGYPVPPGSTEPPILPEVDAPD